MKKIIVPIDFSEYSENALITAASIAKKEKSEIIAVHMLELSDALYTHTKSYAREEAVFFMKIAEKKFNEFLDKDYLKGLTVTPLVRHNKFFNELNEVAKEENANLIVMGSHGATGLKEVFVGSNTEKVVRNSEVPVLVVKGVPVTSNFNLAIFACEFNEDDVAPYKKAKKLLSELGCKLQLLHINTPYGNFKSTAEQQNKVSDFIEMVSDNDKLTEVAFVSDYSVEEGIFDYANLSGSDLIVMATNGRTGLSHFFEGSISEDVANHSTLPVMTFKI